MLGGADIQLCVREVDGWVVSSAGLAFIAIDPHDVTVQTVVDGNVVQSNGFSTPAGPTRRVTVASSHLTSEVFRTDRTAVTRLLVDGATVDSDPLP